MVKESPFSLRRHNANFLTALVIKKKDDPVVADQLVTVCNYFATHVADCVVLVEPAVFHKERSRLPAAVRTWCCPISALPPSHDDRPGFQPSPPTPIIATLVNSATAHGTPTTLTTSPSLSPHSSAALLPVPTPGAALSPVSSPLLAASSSPFTSSSSTCSSPTISSSSSSPLYSVESSTPLSSSLLASPSRLAVDGMGSPERDVIDRDELGEYLSTRVDLVVCLGGDGTLLHINTLFSNHPVPPCLNFNLGSLGFLTPFPWDHRFGSVLETVIRGKFFQVSRARLQCFSSQTLPDSPGGFSPSASYRFLGTALNEVTIDRGMSPYLTNLEISCDGTPITNIQADGLIVATSTGSTAYSLSAGGTMMHPSVPALQLTPICPHSLTTRPICLPDSVTLRVSLHPDARSSAWVHLDGRHRFEMKKTDHLVLQISPHSLPCITPTDHISDWFRSLANCLNWNSRIMQQVLPSSSAL